KRNGYIHKNHISNVMGKKLRGIAAKNKTNIRSEPSTQSKILTHFNRGTILEYKIYNKNWSEIKIKVNSKMKTGYVHKKHVETAISNPESIKGVAIKSKTYIRTGASTKSAALTTVPKGEVLNLKTFSKYWYEVEIKVNGKNQVGYV